jgi:hypothetical protein
MEAETTSETTGPDLVRWRREQLTDAGFGPPLAADLARDTRYDLHELIQLVERGCGPEIAVRILAPIEWHTAA